MMIKIESMVKMLLQLIEKTVDSVLVVILNG